MIILRTPPPPLTLPQPPFPCVGNQKHYYESNIIRCRRQLLFNHQYMPPLPPATHPLLLILLLLSVCFLRIELRISWKDHAFSTDLLEPAAAWTNLTHVLHIFLYSLAVVCSVLLRIPQQYSIHLWAVPAEVLRFNFFLLHVLGPCCEVCCYWFSNAVFGTAGVKAWSQEHNDRFEFSFCVFRDLAARNCLVMGDHTLKIGDYGIAEDLFRVSGITGGYGTAGDLFRVSGIIAGYAMARGSVQSDWHLGIMA